MEIRINGLTKVFPGNPKKNIPDTVAVGDFNVTVEDGTLMGLLGPSGCGKTTLLKIIGGFVNQTSGDLYFGDKKILNGI